MNPSEHLTDIQIAAFIARRLPESESHAIGSHLLGCVNCRGLLPLPAPDDFWTAVMSEKPSDQSLTFSASSIFRERPAFFSSPRSLAWGTGSLVVILSLTILILFTVSKESSVESDIAKTVENENSVSRGADQTAEPRLVLPRPERNVPNNEQPTVSTAGPQLPNRSDSRSTQDVIAGKTRRTPSRATNINISSTRGAISKCGVERTFEMQLGLVGSDLELTWEPVPNAAKYHLYISDENEILIDEYETDRDTSYTLKKSLDPNKGYKWKIVITLENGQTQSVDARKFSAKDFQSNQKVRKSTATSDTRCSMGQ